MCHAEIHKITGPQVDLGAGAGAFHEDKVVQSPEAFQTGQGLFIKVVCVGKVFLCFPVSHGLSVKDNLGACVC